MPYETLTYGRITWTNITQPAPADMERLREAYPHFHPLALEDCLSHLERPKIDEYDNHLFIVMHYPRWDQQRRISRPAEVDYFIGANYLVTVHDGDLRPLSDFFEQCQADEATRQRFMGKGASQLLHAVVDLLVDYIFPMLYKVDANIRAVEEDLFAESTQSVVQTISYLRRDIIALRRIIRPQLPILRNLEEVDRPFIREDLDVYFGDILDHLEKARDIVEDSSEVVSGLADTADTLASHRINEVMRILTVISVIMLPLTLIAGILGMNVALPFARHPYAFWGILGVMFVVSLSMLVYFRYRRWL